MRRSMRALVMTCTVLGNFPLCCVSRVIACAGGGGRLRWVLGFLGTSVSCGTMLWGLQPTTNVGGAVRVRAWYHQAVGTRAVAPDCHARDVPA